jgi:hypothetical protein
LLAAGSVAFVRGLVGGFDVHADNVGAGQSVDRVAPLGGVVGVGVAGGARNFDPLPADECSQASQQVNGRDHHAAFAVRGLERRQRRRSPQTPQPDVGGRQMPLFHAGGIDRMVGEQAHAVAHQLIQQIAPRAARIIVQHALIGQVVRRRSAGIAAERGRLTRSAVDQ